MVMTTKEEINTFLTKMILSASGWRGIFAENGDEESVSLQISQAHRIISGAAALVFAEYLKDLCINGKSDEKPLVLVGSDTRPTGESIAAAMIPVILALDCEVRYSGFTAAPQIMAWARSLKSARTAGFIYISASHNPVGHNGLKFGLTDGGVLASEEINKLIASFKSFFETGDYIYKIESLISAADSGQLKNVYDRIDGARAHAYKAYFDFCKEVAFGAPKSGDFSIAAVMKDGLAGRSLGIVCDFNGSARTVSIDKEFFCAPGFKFEYINGQPGQIVHRIVPEGQSLEPCVKLLEEVHARDSSFLLGYVPDCDGDRGNLVIWDDTINRARSLEAQEVFALAVIAELSHLVWTGDLIYDNNGMALSKAAVAVNDPTSLRIDRIAGFFGVSVFRAEVGEANVVSLARKLRENGYIVRILGEGSAGGNITYPSAVRDPINTVLALAKMLSVRSAAGKPGLFEIWLKKSGQIEKYRGDFSLADIIASLPPFLSTPSYSKDALLSITTKDHGLLKSRYQQIFTREWEKRKDELKTRFGFMDWEAIAYNGIAEKRRLDNFGEAGRGGLKVSFFNIDKEEIACIWMRGSATEPVFRIMADVAGSDTAAERFLLDWQQCMIMEADASNGASGAA